MEREYIARWCPLNMSLISEYLEMEKLTEDSLQSNIPNVIFDLPASSYAIVTMDFRHLRKEDYRWTYGEDYAISFTIHDEISIDDPADP
jgi:hypothetical protein